MQPKSPKLLADISDAAAFILESTRGKTLEDYRRPLDHFGFNGRPFAANRSIRDGS